VNNLAALADELRDSVSTFHLPGLNGDGHGADRGRGVLSRVNGSGGRSAALPEAPRAPALARK
jgi:hypothetical protein